jgi:hypothetical protein
LTRCSYGLSVLSSPAHQGLPLSNSFPPRQPAALGSRQPRLLPQVFSCRVPRARGACSRLSVFSCHVPRALSKERARICLSAGGWGQPWCGSVGPEQARLRNRPHHGGSRPHICGGTLADSDGHLPRMVRGLAHAVWCPVLLACSWVMLIFLSPLSVRVCLVKVLFEWLHTWGGPLCSLLNT